MSKIVEQKEMRHRVAMLQDEELSISTEKRIKPRRTDQSTENSKVGHTGCNVSHLLMLCPHNQGSRQIEGQF